MVKKCKKCKVPLEGFGYKFIARPIFGVKPGKNGCCNKCEVKLQPKTKLGKKRRK
jgi:hypothetical protein